MQNMLRFQQAGGVVGMNGDLRQKALQNNRNGFGHPYVIHTSPHQPCAYECFLPPRDHHGALANENHDVEVNSSNWRSWRQTANNK